MITISQYGNRYVIETAQGRMHILNLNSLEYNLRKVFGWNKTQVLGLLYQLQTTNSVQVAG